MNEWMDQLTDYDEKLTYLFTNIRNKYKTIIFWGQTPTQLKFNVVKYDGYRNFGIKPPLTIFVED